MGLLLNLVLVIQMVSAVAMVGLILLQQGKGADMGTSFGSGSSGSLFGATGGASFMSRMTGMLAAVFFVCTLILAYFGNLKPTTQTSVLESAAPAAAASAPTAPTLSAPTPTSSSPATQR